MKFWSIILLGWLFLIPNAGFGQVKPRVEGLGNNAEYMSLLEQEQRLVQKEDSLGRVITRVREEFRAHPTERDKYANEILRLEGELFEVKNQTGIVAGKLSEIEELFILTSMQAGEGAPKGPDDGRSEITQGREVMLVNNPVFREKLPAEDYRALVEAQSLEPTAAGLLVRYYENYDKIAAIGPQYEAAENAQAADSIYAGYMELDRMNAETADSLARVWSTIFDNKMFAYNYLLETQNELRLLARFDAEARDVRDQIARQREQTASEEVLTYLNQKSLLFEYEKTLADLFRLPLAADSIGTVREVFDMMIRPMPPVNYQERIFIDYENISVQSPAKYNNSNPIPELALYNRGIVYRILVGTYTQRQAVSLFKGLYPLGYLRQADGRWAYYAGGYRELEDAKNGLETVIKRGFRNALIVVWNNGEPVTLRSSEYKRGDRVVTYRVEISGIDGAIPDQIVEVVNGIDNTVDITHPGELFAIGPYPTSMDAETVASAIRRTVPGLEVRVVENQP